MMNNPFKHPRFYSAMFLVLMFAMAVWLVGCVGNMIEIDMSRDEIGVQNNHAIRVEPVRTEVVVVDGVLEDFPEVSPTTGPTTQP